MPNYQRHRWIEIPRFRCDGWTYTYSVQHNHLPKSGGVFPLIFPRLLRSPIASVHRGSTTVCLTCHPMTTHSGSRTPTITCNIAVTDSPTTDFPFIILIFNIPYPVNISCRGWNLIRRFRRECNIGWAAGCGNTTSISISHYAYR